MAKLQPTAPLPPKARPKAGGDTRQKPVPEKRDQNHVGNGVSGFSDGGRSLIDPRILKELADVPPPTFPGKDGCMHDAELQRLLRNALSRVNGRAQRDPTAFFERVLREEHTRQPIKVAPHQRVGMDFILKHERSVNFWPISHGKTWTLAGIILYVLGTDPTARIAIVSATQGQATKVLSMVKDYIEFSMELRSMFGHLRKSSRSGDPWTQTAITIERPPGIRDPSVIAAGINGEGMPGSRLSFIVLDDVLNFENTATKEQRDRIHGLFDSQVLSRLDPRGGRIALVNTAWHSDDLLHRLEKGGWPTIRMGVTGEIEVKTPPILDIWGRQHPDRWGIDDDIAEHIRPMTSNPSDTRLRLVAHDPDPSNTRTLWPARLDAQGVERARRDHLPMRFNQLYLNICRATDDTARCKEEWIELCKQRARELGHTASMPFGLGLVDTYDGSLSTYTGVDLAIGLSDQHDDTAFFTFAVLPSRHRLILDIEIGKFDGPTIIRKIIDKHQRFNSIITVESNQSQAYLHQFTLQQDVSVPIRPFVTTGKNKLHPSHGVESLLVELSNGAWLIPNDAHGHVCPPVQKFIDACLYYNPAKHVDDVLMACFFAREQARHFGALTAGGSEVQGSLSMMLNAR